MEEKLMACARCRKALAIKKGAKVIFCPDCGSKLVDMPYPVEKWTTFSKEERNRVFNSLSGAAPVQNKPAKKTSVPRWVWIALGSVLVLCLIFGAYMLGQRQRKPDNYLSALAESIVDGQENSGLAKIFKRPASEDGYAKKTTAASNEGTGDMLGISLEPVSGPVSNKLLKKTRDILSKRVKYYTEDGMVYIDGTHINVEIPATTTDPTDIFSNIMKVGGIQFVANHNSEGLINYDTSSDGFTYELTRSKEELYSDDSILLDENNISDIEVVEEDDYYRLKLSIDKKATSNLSDFAFSDPDNAHVAIFYSGIVLQEARLWPGNYEELLAGYFDTKEAAQEAQMIIQSGTLPFEPVETDSYVR